MSRAIGRVSYQNEGRSPFMAGGGGANQDGWSEKTAREIDEEVRRILSEAESATRAILSKRRMALEDVTSLLIERESIDTAELQAALDRHPFDLASLGLPTTARPTLLPPPREDVPPFRAGHA
jgi:cell division protease FtsH